jgi:integrase
MVRVQLLTGMRPGEIVVLRPCDLDHSGDVWLYNPARHKTEYLDHDKTVAVGPRAQEVLLKYLARAADDYCFQPRDSEKKRLAQRKADRKTPLSCTKQLVIH